jgi:hypothetical protein
MGAKREAGATAPERGGISGLSSGARRWRAKSRRRRGWLALPSLMLVAIGSLGLAASAAASCPVPQGTHYQGTYELESSSHNPIGSGTFDTIGKEFNEAMPGEFTFNAIASYEGTYLGKKQTSTVSFTGGSL